MSEMPYMNDKRNGVNEFYKYKGFQTQDSTIEYVWPKN